MNTEVQNLLDQRNTSLEERQRLEVEHNWSMRMATVTPEQQYNWLKAATFTPTPAEHSHKVGEKVVLHGIKGMCFDTSWYAKLAHLFKAHWFCCKKPREFTVVDVTETHYGFFVKEISP